MNNVREGKVNSSVRLLGKKGEPKALLISGATARVIDLREMPKRLVSELVSPTEPEVKVTDETPLVSPLYSSNVGVVGASAVAGFDVTQAPPVTPEIVPVQKSTSTLESNEHSDIPEIVPVSISMPSVQEPVVEPIINTPMVEMPNTETPVVELPKEEKVIDPVVSAIDKELVSPQTTQREVEPVLQTPQEFSKEEESREITGAYVSVIDEMLKVKERHLLGLRKLQEETNEKFEALKEKYEREFDEIVRKTEKLREEKPNFAPIQEALNNQNEMLNNQYNQGIGNVR